MKKPHFTKGKTGEVLRSVVLDAGALPLRVKLHRSVALILTAKNTFFGLTVRGSAHCCRKQARQLQRWLSAEQAKGAQ
jgi:hypothetical protein